MSQLLFINQSFTVNTLLQGTREDTLNEICSANRVSNNTKLDSNSFFSIESTNSALGIRAILSNTKAEEKQCLSQIIQSCGQESIALAKFYERYFSDENVIKLNTFIGASTTASITRLDGFEKAVVEYQNSLIHLKKLSDARKQGKTDFLALTQAKKKVKTNYEILKTAYASALNRLSPVSHRTKNRGTALSNAERGITLATTNKRNGTHLLNVHDTFEASHLVKLGKVVNGLGNSTVALDAGLRVNTVLDIKDSGGDWMQESAKQITGLGFAGALGGLSGKAVMVSGTWLAVQTGLTLAGPLGWAVLGTLFLGSVAAGYFVGNRMDEIGKDVSGLVYNQVW